jgi:DNA-binding NarL/FixJ family response regulator
MGDPGGKVNNGKVIKVLLADDHAMVREGLAAIVQNDEHIEVVGHCSDGLEVLSKVEQFRPDVVVLDITMPRLNGLDACAELTRRFKATGVLILTMHNDEQFVARSLASGALGYLAKEAAASRLTEAVHAVARGEVYLGPGIPRSVVTRAALASADPYNALSTRERQILQMIAEGKTNRRIAEELKLSVKTVDTHRTRLMHKLNIHNQTALVKYALKRGLTTLQ